MANVQFDEPTFASSARTKRTSSLEKIVFSTGLAKTSSGAQMVLLVGAIVMIVVAVFLVFPKHAKTPVPPPVPVATTK